MEYAILVAAIAAVILAVVFVLGTWVKATFTDTCDSFNDAGTNPGTRTCSS